MTFNFIYEQDIHRVIMAVEIDARATNPDILGKTGDVIKAFIDAKVALVTSNVIMYKIETDTGNLAGYFTLKIDGTAGSLYFTTLRPAFVQFSGQISQNMSSFIASGAWRGDYLFP